MLRVDFKQINEDDKSPNGNPDNCENICTKITDNKPLIIALSAFINPDIITRCHSAGFDDYIESPLTKDKIMQKIITPLEKRKVKKSSNLGGEFSDNERDDSEDAMQRQFEDTGHDNNNHDAFTLSHH